MRIPSARTWFALALALALGPLPAGETLNGRDQRGACTVAPSRLVTEQYKREERTPASVRKNELHARCCSTLLLYQATIVPPVSRS